MEPEALTADEFNSVVSAVTNAFGDPTRREIYLFARDAGATGVTAGEVAEHFALHPNVARHHLEKLTGGGYLIVEIGKRAADGPARAAGRPSKRYLAGPLDATLALPLKHDDLLAGLLAARARRARARAGRDARRRGRLRVRHDSSPRAWTRPRVTARCAPRSPRSPTRSPRTASPRTPRRATVSSRSCRSAARSARPRSSTRTSCARSTAGMIRGMLAGLYGETSPQFETSRPDGGDHCVARV